MWRGARCVGALSVYDFFTKISFLEPTVGLAWTNISIARVGGVFGKKIQSY